MHSNHDYLALRYAADRARRLEGEAERARLLRDHRPSLRRRLAYLLAEAAGRLEPDLARRLAASG